MKFHLALLATINLILTQSALAHEHSQHAPPSTTVESCGEMEVMDFSMGMCMPLAMKGMPMSMVMFQYNSFLNQTAEEGPRGRSALTAPNMFMLDIGTSVGDSHYLNLDFMGTLERWTYPDAGYPELLQIGEENQNRQKYIDAQHPHSSPIMGLTLSDTIHLGNAKDNFKIWLAPRGQATDGPVAFMHRPTGMVNPDAPLGHHIGQDVGHITSTVVGSSLRLGNTSVEISTFNGTEPAPTKVDLPLGRLNSYAARITQIFSPQIYAMASAAFVKDPEPGEPSLDHVSRYSASIYNTHAASDGWTVQNAFIYGLVNFYDSTAALNSFAEEFWFRKDRENFWGRLEVLQRTAGELQITSGTPNEPLWVTAMTLGYTYQIVNWSSGELGLGASITKDFLPPEFQSAYGGQPLSGKIFIKLSGMSMREI